MAMNGTDVLLLIDTNLVASQRDLGREETTEEIDVSSKDQREKRVLPGRYGSTLSLGALYVPTDAAYIALQNAMRNGIPVTVVLMEAGVVAESAQALITALSESYPDQAEAVISAALTIDGAWLAGS
jgi:hypothetical protein